MVGTVEQELDPAGKGTKLADYQPFVIDRVMIQQLFCSKSVGSETKSL